MGSRLTFRRRRKKSEGSCCRRRSQERRCYSSNGCGCSLIPLLPTPLPLKTRDQQTDNGHRGWMRRCDSGASS